MAEGDGAMDFADRIKALASRVERQKGSVQTEEACKNAFVMPFLNALGYDVFNPEVVVPEFTCDVGVKKGEKVDYAIRVDGELAILVECKGCGASLANSHMSQLYRYFSVTAARFAILTNGIEYWFYSDLDEPNKMDQRPFFQFDVLEYRPQDVEELRKFASDRFDMGKILATASNLKYSSAIKTELVKEFDTPSEEMVRLLVTRVFDGRFTQKVKEDFSSIVAGAFRDAIRDLVNRRLTSALEAGSEQPSPAESASSETDTSELEVVTTEEELEAYHIIKAIVRNIVKAERIHMRDAKSYCAILLDDNNRKPLARLHFNGKSNRYIGLFTDKQEERIKIDRLDDIYSFADRLQQTALLYGQQ
jgi:predicted type IV restriction endonuclease